MLNIRPSSMLVMAFAAAVLALPSLGLILPEAGLATRHGRELAPGVTWAQIIISPKAAASQAKSWLRDRIGLGLFAARGYRLVSYYLFRDSPAVNLARNGDFVFLTARDAAGPDPYGVLRETCPPSEHWPALEASIFSEWLGLKQSLEAVGYNAYSIIVPSKPTLYADKLPPSVPEEIRRNCLNMSDAASPFKVAAQSLNDFFYPFDRFAELRDVEHFYPPENFHADGLSIHTAAEEFFLRVRPGLGVALNLQPVKQKADLVGPVGFERSVMIWRPEDRALGGQRQMAAEAAFKKEPQFEKFWPSYNAYSNPALREDRGALVIGNSFSSYVAYGLSFGYSRMHSLVLNAASPDDIGVLIFNKFLLENDIDDIIFVHHDGEASAPFLVRFNDAIQKHGIASRSLKNPVATPQSL